MRKTSKWTFAAIAIGMIVLSFLSMWGSRAIMLRVANTPVDMNSSVDAGNSVLMLGSALYVASGAFLFAAVICIGICIVPKKYLAQ